MLNRQDFPFMSALTSKKRMDQAIAILGSAAPSRILAFALYLLGANLQGLAKFVDIPLDTVKSLVKRMLSDGLPALEDRRCRTSTFLPQEETKGHSCKLLLEEETIVVQIDNERRIELSRHNPIQCRTVLLTLLNADLLDLAVVSEALGLSKERIRKLRKKLIDCDVAAVIDQRSGQKKDYLFTADIKAELVQQFAANAISGQSTSSHAIARNLAERCEMELPERSIRLHLKKLGLPKIARSLPELVLAQKKTS
jgi:hypothetical protein